jgi:hypothetical protein
VFSSNYTLYLLPCFRKEMVPSSKSEEAPCPGSIVSTHALPVLRATSFSDSLGALLMVERGKTRKMEKYRQQKGTGETVSAVAQVHLYQLQQPGVTLSLICACVPHLPRQTDVLCHPVLNHSPYVDVHTPWLGISKDSRGTHCATW